MLESNLEKKIDGIETEKQNEFEKYKQEVAESVGLVQKRIEEEQKNRRYIDLENYPVANLKKEIGEIVEGILGVQGKDLTLSVPPTHVISDFTLEVFNLAKKSGEKPNELAKKIVDNINERKTDLIKEASVAGAFVNIEVNKEKLYQETLSRILELGERYGESDINAGKTAIIDYSSPNIAKPIGIGHLRSTIIGQALANIYHETGYSVVRDNHLGDWGTQFGSLIYAYKEWGDEKKIKENPMRELKELYVKFSQLAKEHPEIKDNARELFSRLEKKDPELIALWKRFRDLSLEDFKHVYEELGIKFDTNIGESYFTEKADKLVDECLLNGFCKKDEDSEAVIVEKIGEIPSFLLRKQDGSSLYLARDLATIQFRAKIFNPETVLYVVGNEQDLNFKQLLELGKRAGYIPENMKAKHISFGMVLRDGKKMSTREGTLIELNDLISQSVDKSKEILRLKNPNIGVEELKKVSKIVGIGAIIYDDLRQSRTKNISFDWNRMLDLEGGSAVYLQYTYVRINSILKKIAENYGELNSAKLKKNDISFENKSEFDLAKKLMMFPEIVAKAQKTDSPHQICGYLEELSQLFNSFYNAVSIMKTADQKLRNSRVALIEGVALVVKKGLALLNVEVPEKM